MVIREGRAGLPASARLRPAAALRRVADLGRGQQTRAAGGAGEIVAKCEGQMRGFWNNPEATAERIVDGWVKIGDIGRLDANGYLYMLDAPTRRGVRDGRSISHRETTGRALFTSATTRPGKVVLCRAQGTSRAVPGW